MAQLTEIAIDKIRSLIVRGDLPPGAALPPEEELAGQLGSSRNTTREAVRALVTARVLDVALLHVSTTEDFVRRVLARAEQSSYV
jgi:DNA-binding FadR family transcriptional regulator